MPLGIVVAVLVLILAAMPGGVAHAQGTAPKDAPPKDAPAKSAPGPAPIAVPDAQTLAMLIHNSVVAVSQANVTGNYGVLHALAAPGFQESNPPQKLAEVFANLRSVDLTPVIIFSPILTQQPTVTENNMLRLTGYYKTTPQQVHFDLLFQPVAGNWRLFGVAIRTLPADAPQPAASLRPPASFPKGDAPAKAAEKKAPAPEKKARPATTPAEKKQ
jgi:hypothetical protein